MSSWMGTQQPRTPHHIHGKSKVSPVPCWRDLIFKGLLIPLDGLGHPSCFPWSSVGQQQRADGAGRWESQGRYQGLAPAPRKSCRVPHTRLKPSGDASRSWLCPCHGWRDAVGPGKGTDTVCWGAGIPSAGLSRQMAAGTHCSLAAHGDLPHAPTLE